MEFGLSLACGILGCLSIVFLVLWLATRRNAARLFAELRRYDSIADIERYTQEQQGVADAAIARAARADQELKSITESIGVQNRTISSQISQIEEHKYNLSQLAVVHGEYEELAALKSTVAEQKEQAKRYNSLLGNFKTAEELKKHIENQSRRVEELKRTIGGFDSLARIATEIEVKRKQLASLETRAADLEDVLGGSRTPSELNARIIFQQNLLEELEAKQNQVEEVLAMQEFGFYQPRYNFESSTEYQAKLDQIRASQKHMVKAGTAVHWDKDWIVEQSAAKGRKMMDEQTKLMLRAFNGECDAAVSKVKYNTATNMDNRITRSCEQINKLGKTNCAFINADFLGLKRQELYLVHEHRIKKQEEKEEQQRIKEMMREEEKVKKELEKAEKDAAKEESKKQRLLEHAQRELELAAHSQRAVTKETESQLILLAEQVAKLEGELKEAIDRKAKAIARAQLTRSGHVYVLSNIGSFGERVYKIGMTRRLEPLDRVKELGDASVPFRFDVHAMIYSEDAPELENKLHKHFAHCRVNLVNLRREYFYTSLPEIMDAVGQYFGQVSFVTVPEAPEYRESLAQRKEEQGSGEHMREGVEEFVAVPSSSLRAY